MQDPVPHALDAVRRRLRIPLWQCSRAIGKWKTDGPLSRALRGIDPLPPDAAERLLAYFEQVDKERRNGQ